MFTWAHGDGGPSHEPAPDGGVAAYWLGKEKRLLAWNAECPEFQRMNAALQGMGDVAPELAPQDGKSVEQYLREQGVAERMLPMAEAGYGKSFLVCACVSSGWTRKRGCFLAANLTPPPPRFLE